MLTVPEVPGNISFSEDNVFSFQISFDSEFVWQVLLFFFFFNLKNIGITINHRHYFLIRKFCEIIIIVVFHFSWAPFVFLF